MEKATRNAINAMTQEARRLLQQEYAEQLDATFDIRPSGKILEHPGSHLSPKERLERSKLVAAIDYRVSDAIASRIEAIASVVRDAAFTTLNRFAALKMLEARGLVQECVSSGINSSGFTEFCGLAPGVTLLPEDAGYRLYLESLFDELSTEIKVLFDRRDVPSMLWPRRNALTELLRILNAPDLAEIWGDDETIGWIYQYFNSKDERQKMRDESQAPRNSRELAVRNQFFTPRYVVEFLVDNTLGRTWMEMHPDSNLVERCDYYVELEDERAHREPKDPREFRILDPACGSGHFLLYSFDLLQTMYEEDWLGDEAGEGSLRTEYPTIDLLRRDLPRLIVENNLYGIDIDPRCAQIAALTLWMRAQRSWQEYGVPPADRPPIRQTHIVVAEPMPGESAMVEEFAASLSPPLLGTLFKKMVATMTLAGEMGYLLKVEEALEGEISKARTEFTKALSQPQRLPGLEDVGQPESLDHSGIDDAGFFDHAEHLLLGALSTFATEASGAEGTRRRLFADDAAHGVAMIELLRRQFDVVLMNPPFGAGSLKAKQVFDRSYPKTKNDLYAAFVERGIDLLVPRGMLGAITSRTGFFLSSFQKWREDIILETAPPTVFADLGFGVLDGAMVEVAAYALQKA